MRALSAILVAVIGLLAWPQAASAAPPPWYPPLRWSPANAANFDVGRAGTAIGYVVIHATDGSYAGALSWFRDPRSGLSAHYVVRASDGEITQAVAEANTAFHARGFNRPSIGIEHEFDPRRGVGYTAAQYRRSATLVCAIARRYGIPADRAHILGHSEVARADHADPGPSWDWSFYMGLVRSCSGSAAASVASAAAPLPPSGCGAVLCAPGPGLARGAVGVDVARLQLALVYLGRLDEADLAGGEGTFGPRTLAAVRAFQRASGVPDTGFYGELSAAALARALALRPPDAPAVDLAIGDESAAVAALQRALRARGYMSVVTGYFGPITRDAVRRLQADHGIVPTGAYGPLTRRALALH